MKRKLRARYEIDEIVASAGAWGGHRAWYKVRWAGYHATWEQWRIEGEVGSPIVTWEPYRTVRCTEALQEWTTARRSQR